MRDFHEPSIIDFTRGREALGRAVERRRAQMGFNPMIAVVKTLTKSYEAFTISERIINTGGLDWLTEQLAAIGDEEIDARLQSDHLDGSPCLLVKEPRGSFFARRPGEGKPMRRRVD